MIHLSPAAVNEINRLLRKQRQPNLFLRVQVKTGGCSGLYYDLRFAEVVKENEQVYHTQSVAIVIDGESLNYLNGLTLDYSEDLIGGAFRFHNPNAVSSCGCGNSFSTGVAAHWQ